MSNNSRYKEAKIIAVLLSLAICFLLPNKSQAQDFPLYEMRGIWLTTLYGLDWPSTPGMTALSQETELRFIIRNAADNGMNTIVFQVVARGDAIYPSSRLPWSSIMTGTLGEDPGWDPLAVAIEESHLHGMELHAWINTYRVAMLENTTPGTPLHISQSQPIWGEKGYEWLNPGFPGVNEWVIEHVAELVENYEVDGVHFDYTRYDVGGYINDAEYFRAFSDGTYTDIDDWRRDNVNRFAADVFARITDIKPWVKVGSTPVGNYDKACFSTPFEGYAQAYQDARHWMEEGSNDYVSPQIYWSTSHSPSFQCLTSDWVDKNTSPRHVYVGVGAYRPQVQVEIPDEIDISRDLGADGQIYFREEFIRNEDFGGRYRAKALVPSAPWRFAATSPTRPQDITIKWDPDSKAVILDWSESRGSSNDPLRGYALFKSRFGDPDMNVGDDLYKVLPDSQNSFVDVLGVVPSLPLVYQVAGVSKLGFLSEGSLTVSSDMTILGGQEEIPATARLAGVFPNPFTDRLTVAYELDEPAEVTIRLLDPLGRPVSEERAGWLGPGRYRGSLSGRGLANGAYYCEFRANDLVIIEPVTLAR